MKSNERRVLITGATGLVGSFLTEQLLRDGCTVSCVARPKEMVTPHERVFSAVYGVNRDFARNRLFVFNGDITKNEAGLSERDLATLTGAVDEVWHCAALTSFDDRYRDDIWRTNVHGTDNVIALSKRLQVGLLYFTSTAYVCERDIAVAQEELTSSRAQFSNAYEESKSYCEHALASSGIPHIIFRLPVIAGRAEDGLTRQYLGFYVFARLFHWLRNKILVTLEDAIAGPKLANEGIFPGPVRRGDTILPLPTLHLPVQIRAKPDGTVNLLPIDIVTETMRRCAFAQPKAGTIVNLTNGVPPTVAELFNMTLSSLGIEGFHLGPEPGAPEHSRSRFLDAYNRIIQSHTGLYTPYIFGEPTFSRQNLETLIGERQLPDFTCTPAYVRKILEYAIATNWRPAC